jgi:hypothetical protein
MAAEQRLGAPVIVPRTTGSERTTIRERLVPLACWRMDDIRFGFASSFINPDAADEFARLQEVRKDNDGALLALFGQADPTGDDETNKVLSGRRALSVYGALVRRVDIWERLFSKPVGRDRWGDAELVTMAAAVGRPAGAPLPRNAAERSPLFNTYMNLLCTDLAKSSFTLDPAADFLAKDADPSAHRGAVQGCSEFNPVLIFSRAETLANAQSKDTTNRDQENAPNRRVVGLLFPASTAIDLKKWPCPAATAGTGPCRKRFFSDAARRRAPADARRTAAGSGDTFACRFFDRLASPTPCGGSGKVIVTKLMLQSFPGVAGAGIANVPFTVRAVGRSERSGRSGPDGSILVVFEEGTTTLLEISGTTYHLQPGGPLPAPATLEGAQGRLALLGYMPGPATGAVTPGFDRAILQYQVDQGLDPDGDQVITATNLPSADLANRLAKDLGA